jgi:allantoinase
MPVDVVIKNGTLVLPSGLWEGSLIIDEGKIIGIMKSSEPKADRVVDAAGRFILPGMVDMHVHLRDPGNPERENFESGTRAAAAGGVTTVMDMPNTIPATVTVKAFEEKKAIVGKKSLVDFGLVAGAGEVPEEELRGLANAGAVAFKSFMIARFKELAADDWQLRKNFEIIADEGLPCLIHAENQVIVDRGVAEAKRLGRVDPLAHCEFRPSMAEAEAASRALMFAEEAGMHLHVCHITAGSVVDILEEAQIRGVDATGETSTNYLLMNEETMKARGPYAKVDPPLRTEADQARLWDALNDGVIDVLASDHAPYTKEEKERGWKNIFDAPSGGVVIETTLPLMLNAVNDGRIGLERLVEVFSTNPAMINGVYPKKGALNIGADADVVIVDMDKQFKIRGEDLKTIQKITPYEGIEGVGALVMTLLRGSVVYEDGQVVGKPGKGKWLRPIEEF